MKSIEEAAEKYAGASEDKYANKALKYCAFDMSYSFEAGARFLQEFIPVTKEYPPYDEDILIQTQKNVYYGKLKASDSLYGDYFQPDLAESDERVRACRITAWRPIFYK